MKKGMVVLLAGAIAVLSSVACQAEELVIRGTQIKGNAGRNAEIVSKTVKLKKSAKIVKIEGAPERLCIQSPAEAPLCGEASELIGKKLAPGNYTAYPNIPMNKERQSVTIHLK